MVNVEKNHLNVSITINILQYKNICEEVVWQIFVYKYSEVPISVLFSIITLPNDFRHGVAGI